MTSGEAVRLRIEELCRENEITVNKLATMSTIQKICDGLGITIQEFFESDLFYHLEQELR